jgi:hypothetical protein
MEISELEDLTVMNMKSTIFCNVTPCSPEEFPQHYQQRDALFLLIISPTLKMEAVCSSETSLYFNLLSVTRR